MTDDVEVVESKYQSVDLGGHDAAYNTPKYVLSIVYNVIMTLSVHEGNDIVDL